MKRRAVAVLAVVVAAVAGLVLSAVPAVAQDGHGHVESNDWNVPLTNIGLL
ncbi:hypothetical protein A6P39_039995 [Streptomyces sp. FXJ1.172]|uniref:hypothetical protein n=1 Tax=Streptomyces sp. FXJ1.172 TaxID=710705 RepID=UPI000A427548|nr:hypothetical protein [Streptomyces sp. FXJ1.172]WEO99737.1 hypothetical protein A6P39_039995 [Streptomyces sp. FXJ1.172]